MKIPFFNIEINRHIAQPLVKKLQEGAELPTKGERQTEPTGVNLFSSLVAEFQAISPDFPVQLLPILENLAMYNSDVSYAVTNIIELGNTPYTVYFDDKIPEAQSKEMSLFLSTKNDKIYRGGLNSLINDLLSQIAITGVASVELVPNERLDDIKEVVLVAVPSIKFVYNSTEKSYQEHQQGNLLGGGRVDSLKKLNPLTYKYYPLQRFSDKPYGIPPFLAALEAIQIERPMINNMKNIVQKVGAFGFLSILVNAPSQHQGELTPAYTTRMENYLGNVYRQAEKGFNKGIVAGFKGTHEFKIEGSSNTVQGASDLFKLVSEMKFSGLKQDPLMFGRNFNVAETLARVIMAKLTTKIANYQKIVASVLQDLLKLRLLLAGYNVDKVEVEFSPSMIGDKLKEEDAYSKQIDNNVKLYDRGIIGQVQVANNLGYDQPDQEEPRTSAVPAAEGLKDSPDDPTATGDITDPKTTGNVKTSLRAVYNSIGGGNTVYPYGRVESLSWSFGDKLMDKYYKKYFEQTSDNFDSATAKAVKEITKNLALLDSAVPVDQIVDNIRYYLYKTFGRDFSPLQAKIAQKNIEAGYRGFKKSKEYFGGIAKKIPESTFGLNDIRAVEFFKNSDTYYLGKFITDEDVTKRITAYIKENYLEGDLPVGTNSTALRKFKAAFGEVIKLEDWKIEQILTTTVSNMRNTAGLYYLDEAGIAKYEIVGVPDSLQSRFCQSINGKEFEVKLTVTAMDAKYSTEPSQIGFNSPFGVSLATAEQVANLDSAALQALGIGTPPYHPHCRTRIIGVL